MQQQFQVKKDSFYSSAILTQYYKKYNYCSYCISKNISLKVIDHLALSNFKN